MKTFYFCLDEQPCDDFSHIGVVYAHTTEELYNKILLACQEHFDADVRIEKNSVDIDDARLFHVVQLNVYVGDYNTTIEITKTWLY